MSQCPNPDAIIAIGDALDWEIADGLSHLQTCEDCRVQLELLQTVRSGFTVAEPVDAATLHRITSALGRAGRLERERSRVRERWIGALEPLLAGFTGLVIIVSSGIAVANVLMIAAAFLAGAGLFLAGRYLAWAIPGIGFEPMVESERP